MDTSVLAPWRDLSIVWLGILTAIFVAVPGIAFFFAVRGLRALRRWLRPQLLLAQVWALRIQYGVTRASYAVAGLPIRLHSGVAQARVTTRGIIDFLRG